MIRTGKGNSGKNQDMVTLASCEYAHWTLWSRSVQPQATVGRPHEKFTGVTLIWNFLVTWFEPLVVLHKDLWVLDRRHCFINLVLTLMEILLGQGHAWSISWHLVSLFNSLPVYTSSMSSIWFNHFVVIAFMRVAKGCAKTKSTDIRLWLWSIFFWLQDIQKGAFEHEDPKNVGWVKILLWYLREKVILERTKIR